MINGQPIGGFVMAVCRNCDAPHAELITRHQSGLLVEPLFPQVNQMVIPDSICQLSELEPSSLGFSKGFLAESSFTPKTTELPKEMDPAEHHTLIQSESHSRQRRSACQQKPWTNKRLATAAPEKCPQNSVPHTNYHLTNFTVGGVVLALVRAQRTRMV